MRKTPTLKRAAQWIAFNHSEEDLNLDAIENYICTCLVADLFGKTPREIAAEVYKYRVYRNNDLIFKRSKNEKKPS